MCWRCEDLSDRLLSAVEGAIHTGTEVGTVGSREPQGCPQFDLRLSQTRNSLGYYDQGTKVLHDAFLKDNKVDEIFICGPNPMIDDVAGVLQDLGYDKSHIHSERFRAGLKGETARRPKSKSIPKDGTQVSIVVDGQRQSFHMRANDSSILDAGRENGLELPYSCKGGVCSTCRCKLVKGDVDMALNYALEPWELERGFILTCQSTPKTAEIELDYDQT